MNLFIDTNVWLRYIMRTFHCIKFNLLNHKLKHFLSKTCCEREVFVAGSSLFVVIDNIILYFGGEGGIRTLDILRRTGFQDQRTRPTMRPLPV